MQGFAYATLIVKAEHPSNSDTDSSRESGYLLPTVTGAMYLLVASTTHDLRAGYSLSVNGSCAGHRAFGIGLLIVYGIMITAAMTVLVSTSENSAPLVLNAVTVLFIADLDEKALKFLSTIPPKWRLFWSIESIGMSFALALVAIVYIGDSSPLLERDNVILKGWSTWFIWWFNPAAVTLASVVLHFVIQRVCDFCSEACVGVHESTVGVQHTSAMVRFGATIKVAKERLKEEPCFYATLAIWLAQVVPNWFFYVGPGRFFPLAFHLDLSTAGDGEARLVMTHNKLVLIYSSAILPLGVATKALGVIRRSCGNSRVPSLLVGWGIAYWLISLLYLLSCSWHGSGCRWNNTPSAVTFISYVILPCFLLGCVFMVADTNFLGTRLERLVKPATDRMRNRHRVEYWVMASVFRDFLVFWVGYCKSLSVNLS